MTENVVDVVMPHMGVSVEEGTLSAWLIEVGDAVEAEQPVCEVTTDKVDVEVVSPASGVCVAILVDVGETCPVGDPLAQLTLHGAEVPGRGLSPASDGLPAPALADAPPRAEPHSTMSLPAQSAPEASSVPIVAQLLAGALIDPARAAEAVRARRGRPRRVAVTDRHARTGGIRASPPPAMRADEPADGPAERLGKRERALPRGYDDVPYQIVLTSNQRRAISEHMTRSRQTAAHMTTEVDVDLEPAALARERLNEQRTRAGAARVSVLPFIARVAVSVLADFPDLNATFEHDRNVRWREVNLGVAVDSPVGLVVPVIRRAADLSVPGLADAIADLAAKARARKLMPDDVRAGTFTISNPGSVGAVSAPAIINQPQVAILGMPSIVRRPWVKLLEDGSEVIAIRPIMRMALTFDHRAVDGAEATRYLVAVRNRLETYGSPDL